MEDDLYGSDHIGFKIFLRSDLYDRLNFSALGPDKAEDNTLRLVWSEDEIREFIARRLYLALENRGIWSFKDIIDSTDMSEYSLRWYERNILKGEKSGFKYHFSSWYRKYFGRKKFSKTLFEKIELVIIDKLFEKNLIHECMDGNIQTIPSEEFFATHFLDGNNSCTPRYILVFLKELISETAQYYSNSPNIFVIPVLSGNDWVYNLFTPDLVYKAYINSKEKYIRHVSKVDDKWTGHIFELLDKQKSRQSFDFKWIAKHISFPNNDNDQEALKFLIFLQVIGFFQIKKYHQDIKRRQYNLPVLYKAAKGSVLKST